MKKSSDNNSNLVGTKVKLKDSIRKFTHNGREYSLPEYKLNDPGFEDKVKKLYKSYKIFLPDTRLNSDSNPGRVNIFIDPTGIVTQVTKS